MLLRWIVLLTGPSSWMHVPLLPCISTSYSYAQAVSLPGLHDSSEQDLAQDSTSTQWTAAYCRAQLCHIQKEVSLIPEAAEIKQTFSSFGGRPRFRGLCSWALFRGDLEPLSEEPEDTLFFPSPMFFFTFPSDRLSLRFSSPEFGLLLSSLELRRFLSSAELWDDVWKFNNNNDNHHNSFCHHHHHLRKLHPVISTLHALPVQWPYEIGSAVIPTYIWGGRFKRKLSHLPTVPKLSGIYTQAVDTSQRLCS